MPLSEPALATALEVALSCGDGAALVELYQQAAALRPAEAGMFLTHAYVHALDTGSEKAAPLRARLVALGAEA